MILAAGSHDARSFTDGTSLPPYGGAVSIHAQVIREQPHDWFYRLLQRAPDYAGELKSSVITATFFNLRDYERRKVLATLKAVRIHITDPTFDVNQALSDIVPGGDVPGFFQRLDKERRHPWKTNGAKRSREKCCTTARPSRSN